MQYSEILKSSSNIFNYYYIIDIINDKIVQFDNNFNPIMEESFSNYAENVKKTIHTEDINKYFDSVSLTKLSEEKGKGNNLIICNYRKIINSNFINTTNYVKLVEENNNKYVVIFETYSLNNNVEVKDNALKDNEKIKYISDLVGDVIFKIFNAINNVNEDSEKNQIRHTFEYINNILNNMIKEVPELNKGLENQMISEINKKRQTLLIVDDDVMTRNLIKKAFVDEYEILMATNGQEAIDILEKNKNKNSIEIRDNIVGIFLDLAMPVLDGFAVLDYLKINNILSKIPVIIISAAEEKSTRQRVYQYGIADMIEKPFNLELIRYRTNNFINLYRTSNSLDEMISKKNNDFEVIIKQFVNSYLLDNKLEINYINKISNYFLNKLMIDYPNYKINVENIDKIVEASSYYNIGIKMLPKLVDKNSDEHFEHTTVGSEFIKYGLKNILDNDVYIYAMDIAKYHHEFYDGNGYNKLKGDNIPIYVQIVTLAIECSEKLINKNSIDDLLYTIKSEENKKYNPIIVSLFNKYYLDLFN